MEPKFKFKDTQFIKLYRKMLNWQWYDDVNTKVLFLHCLLRANWTSGEWHGIHYGKGEFITSIKSLAEETGLTSHQVRTALNHLILTGEVSSRVTDNVTGKRLTRNRIITVNKWNQYQGDDKQSDKQTSSKVANRRQAGVKQASTDREYKDKSIEKNKENSALPVSPDGDPAAALPEDDDMYLPDDIVWDDPATMTDEEAERWIHDGHL